MEKIWITSDLHFGHDREFIWKARGFNSIEEMNETIIQKWKIFILTLLILATNLVSKL